ncbi:MAG TPA: patatin-like phospholipase family protein [Rhizobacter sp.]|nr:patatin-like phospholipase family protein [Rhizobacter sp.]
MQKPATTGLILTGGGARAAYQVGVLKALVQIRQDIRPSDKSNPFPVLTGTSAGAINAAVLASHCDNFDAAVMALAHVWENFRAEQVYRSDSIGVIRTGARWLTMMSMGWVIARFRRSRPRSLLDNSPLHALLTHMVKVRRLHRLMRAGHLQAFAVTASSYSSGIHVTFYDAVQEFVPWLRSQRVAVRDAITIDHLMASAAIPFVFPAVPLNFDGAVEYFGDGSMRQSAPISPAVHLGATRILVIGAGRMHEPPGRRKVSDAYPSVAQIAGHALSNIFLDALAVDVERLQRINNTLALLPAEALASTSLRPIDVLVIAPSERLDDLAAKHINSLPLPVRALLRGVGVSGEGEDPGGAALASYLLFESAYTSELVALGVADTLARREEVVRFFGWKQTDEPYEPLAPVADTDFHTTELE